MNIKSRFQDLTFKDDEKKNPVNIFHLMFKMEVDELDRDDQTCPLFRKISLIINFRLYFSIVPCWVKNLKLSSSIQIFLIYAHKHAHTCINPLWAVLLTGRQKEKTLKTVLSLNFKQKYSLSSCCYSLKNTIHSSKKKCCSSLNIQEESFVENTELGCDKRQKLTLSRNGKSTSRVSSSFQRL